MDEPTIKTTMTDNNEILKLNVGGQHFCTTRATLCTVKDSLLAKMFATTTDDRENDDTPPLVGDAYFLDRDPKTFSLLLNYLRDGCHLAVEVSHKETLQRLRADAEYFGLVELKRTCNTELEHMARRQAAAMTQEKKKNYHVSSIGTDKVIRGRGWRLVKASSAVNEDDAERPKYVFENAE